MAQRLFACVLTDILPAGANPLTPCAVLCLPASLPRLPPPSSLSRHCLPHSLAGELGKTCLWLEEQCLPPADHVSRAGKDSAGSVCVCEMQGAARAA